MTTRTKRTLHPTQAAISTLAQQIRHRPGMQEAADTPGAYGDLMRDLNIDPADDRKLRRMTHANVSAFEVLAWIELGRPDIDPYEEEIVEADIPAGIRFDTPGPNQGQIIDVAYGTFGRGEAGPGDPFMRVIDRSMSRSHPDHTRYYRKTWKE